MTVTANVICLNFIYFCIHSIQSLLVTPMGEIGFSLILSNIILMLFVMTGFCVKHLWLHGK